MKKYLPIAIIVTLVVVIIIYFYTRVSIIKVPRDVIVLKAKNSIYSSKPEVDLLFEKDDIAYYTEQPRFLLDYLDFDLENEQVEVPIINNQNVHDSFVQKTVRSLHSSENLHSSCKNTAVREILKIVGDDSDIKKVLEKIESRNATITNLNNKKEMDILQEVWDKAKKDEDIKAYFLTQLRDCYENYSVVCPTGTITRIISSLAIKNPEKFPRTKESVTSEMLTTASKLRQKLENDDRFLELSDGEQSEKFKTKLLNKYSNDYSSFMTQEEINEIIDPWIDEI
jgi:hypothetical protein